MTITEAMILGLVQGLTEFLPVSSSGHLALGEKILGFGGESSIAFDVLVHVATLVAILIVVFPDILMILRRDRRVIGLLLVGSIPAGVVGILLREHMDAIKSNLLWVGSFFLVTGALLATAQKFGSDRRELRNMTWLDAILVGIAQAIAILPGISRSGSTISAARICGVEPRSAFSFSFLLGTIAIGGATLLEARNFGDLSSELGTDVLVAAFVTAFVSGLASILILRRILVARKLHVFAWYLLPLGIVTIVLHFTKYPS
jgi:undecaprenyl-diphosphatase